MLYSLDIWFFDCPHGDIWICSVCFSNTLLQGMIFEDYCQVILPCEKWKLTLTGVQGKQVMTTTWSYDHLLSWFGQLIDVRMFACLCFAQSTVWLGCRVLITMKFCTSGYLSCPLLFLIVLCKKVLTEQCGVLVEIHFHNFNGKNSFETKHHFWSQPHLKQTCLVRRQYCYYKVKEMLLHYTLGALCVHGSVDSRFWKETIEQLMN